MHQSNFFPGPILIPLLLISAHAGFCNNGVKLKSCNPDCQAETRNKNLLMLFNKFDSLISTLRVIRKLLLLTFLLWLGVYLPLLLLTDTLWSWSEVTKSNNVNWTNFLRQDRTDIPFKCPIKALIFHFSGLTSFLFFRQWIICTLFVVQSMCVTLP